MILQKCRATNGGFKMKYLCLCGEKIETLICSWTTDRYYPRPVLATCWLFCQDCGEKEHQKDIEHSRGRYDPYIDKIFYIGLTAFTKEIAVKQILAQIIPKLNNLYLPATDLKKALSRIKKIKDGSATI